MDINFELKGKTFKKDDGSEIKYYVLCRTLIDNSILEIPIKSEKARLLIMSYNLENKK